MTWRVSAPISRDLRRTSLASLWLVTACGADDVDDLTTESGGLVSPMPTESGVLDGGDLSETTADTAETSGDSSGEGDDAESEASASGSEAEDSGDSSDEDTASTADAETESTTGSDAQAGELVWSDFVDGGAHGADALRSVVVGDDGSYFAIGEAVAPGIEYDVGGILLVRYSANGERVWKRFFEGLHSFADFALDLQVGPSGQLEAVGRREVASGSYAWFGRFASDHGSMSGELYLDTELCVTCTASAILPRAGELSTVIVHDIGMPDYGVKLADVALLDETPTLTPLAVTDHVVASGAVALGAELFLAGQVSVGAERSFWVGRINEHDELEDEYRLGLGLVGQQPQLTAIASDGEDLFVVGDIVMDTEVPRTIVIARLGPDGETRWVQTLDEIGFAQAVALTPTQDIVVAGRSVGTREPGDRGDIWLGVWSSAGEELWTRSFDGPGETLDHAYGLAVDTARNAAVVVGYLGVGDDPIRGRDAWIGRIQL